MPKASEQTSWNNIIKEIDEETGGVYLNIQPLYQAVKWWYPINDACEVEDEEDKYIWLAYDGNGKLWTYNDRETESNSTYIDPENITLEELESEVKKLIKQLI